MARTMEFWANITEKDPRLGAQQAARYEADGWDGAVCFDSQCIFPEVWAFLNLCATTTKSLKLATGVTNPITRHPSVTAAAAATLQLLSGGRAVIGIGRGDSALAHVGAAPMELGRFEPYLQMLQAYLRGGSVTLEEAGAVILGAERNFEKLALGAGPDGSRLNWLGDYDLPKVPLEVMATGPKAIEMGARTADAVILAVGADPDRIRWGIECAREAARAVGRDPDQVKVGCYISIVPHNDIEKARELAAPIVASQARFSIMNKKVVGPASAHQRETFEKLSQVYDMSAHGRGGAQTAVLDAEFIDQFAVVGPPSRCIERLAELQAIGLHRVTLAMPLSNNDEALEASYEMLSRQILPML